MFYVTESPLKESGLTQALSLVFFGSSFGHWVICFGHLVPRILKLPNLHQCFSAGPHLCQNLDASLVIEFQIPHKTDLVIHLHKQSWFLCYSCMTQCLFLPLSSTNTGTTTTVHLQTLFLFQLKTAAPMKMLKVDAFLLDLVYYNLEWIYYIIIIVSSVVTAVIHHWCCLLPLLLSALSLVIAIAFALSVIATASHCHHHCHHHHHCCSQLWLPLQCQSLPHLVIIAALSQRHCHSCSQILQIGYSSVSDPWWMKTCIEEKRKWE